MLTRQKMRKKKDYIKSENGFYCPLAISLVVSEDGQWVAGLQITSDQHFQLVKENYDTGVAVDFQYIHESPAETVVLNEQKNLIMTGGLDKMAVVYDWVSGEVIKVLDIIIGPISSLFRIGSLMILSENHRLRFVDTCNDVEIKMKLPVESHCKFVSCMDIGCLTGPEEGEKEQVLIFGGSDSAKLNIMLIEEDLKGRVIRLWSTWWED
jgi:hypothetical protein